MMATMKVKNAAGEWVEVPGKALLGEIAHTLIPKAADYQGYDLSSYVAPGDDFILFLFIGGTYKLLPYMWVNSQNKLTQYIDFMGTAASADNYNDFFQGVSISSEMKVSYDDATRILKVGSTSYIVGAKALLFYVR